MSRRAPLVGLLVGLSTLGCAAAVAVGSGSGGCGRGEHTGSGPAEPAT